MTGVSVGTALYDTKHLLTTLPRHVCFDTLNASDTAFVVTAVDVERGQLKCTLAKAREAIAKGEQPTSATGLGVARECLDIVAKVMHRDADEAFLEWARKHQARSLRYRELLAILRNDDTKEPSGREWLWLNSAMRPQLQPAA